MTFQRCGTLDIPICILPFDFKRHISTKGKHYFVKLDKLPSWQGDLEINTNVCNVSIMGNYYNFVHMLRN